MHSPETLPPNPEQPDIPALPENATPEEIDRHWLAYTYQGHDQPQLTVRAVLMGGVIGMMMSLSNLYTTLKLGWSFGVTITACVLSYVLWNAVRAVSGGRLSQMSLLENNCMQSTASAAGYSTGSTVGVAFAALLLVTGVHQPWLIVTLVVLLTAALGVFVAIPMKRQMINHEQLKFPSGIATAETLRSLYAQGSAAVHKAWALLSALAFGGIVGFLLRAETLAEQLRLAGKPQGWLEFLLKIKIPEEIPLPEAMNPAGKTKLAGFVFEPSVLLIGAGMIVGARVSFSMLASSAMLYWVLVPKLMAWDAIHSGLAGYVPSLALKGGMINPVRWALWGGTSIMLFSSLTSLALQWPTLVRAFKRKPGAESETDALANVEVPRSWFYAGLIPISIGLVIVQWLAFHIAIPLGIVTVVMSFVAALVCCRATGETDTTPIGAMGKLTQLVYATLPGAAGQTVINLMTAGITAAAGASAADLLTDLKSGYLLGANGRKQFIAQFLGIFFGVLIIVPAWYLLVPDKAALEKFNPPAANMWKAVADLLTQGIHMLPKTAMVAILAGAVIGIVLPLIERFAKKAQAYLPSAMGLGLGLVIPFQNSLSFALGALIALVWTKAARRSAESFNIPVASGFVAGESLVAAVIGILSAAVGLLAGK